MWKDNSQLVMLPTKCKENALKGYSDKSLLFDYKDEYKILDSEVDLTCYYQLYLINNEEIKENYTGFAIVTVKDDPRIHYLVDVIISEKNQCYCKGDRKFSYQYYSVNPIIAATDPSLNLPQFPFFYLKEYVNKYNSKKSMDVEVEYVCGYWLVQENNIISIRFKEDAPRMYSKEDVEELCRNAFKSGEAYRTSTHHLFKESSMNEDAWIKVNL